MAILLFAMRAIGTKIPSVQDIQDKVLGNYIHKISIQSLEFQETPMKLTYGICRFTADHREPMGVEEYDRNIQISDSFLKLISRLTTREFKEDVTSAVAFSNFLMMTPDLIPQEQSFFEITDMLADYYRRISNTEKDQAAAKSSPTPNS